MRQRLVEGRAAAPMTRPGAAFTVLAALSVVLIHATACVVTSSDGRSPQGAVFQSSQRVVVDLRVPPSREQVGVATGRNSFIVERTSSRMLEVSFTLPGGQVLSVPAIGVVFSAAPAAGPAPQPVERIIVNRVEQTVHAARTAVREDAAVLGLDAAAIDDYFAQGRPGEPVHRVFGPSRLGYLRVEVEVRRLFAHDRTAIDYMFSWGSMLRP